MHFYSWWETKRLPLSRRLQAQACTSKVNFKVSPSAVTTKMHWETVTSCSVRDSPAERIRLSKRIIVGDDRHSREIHTNFAELRQSGFGVIHSSGFSWTSIPCGVRSVRQPFGVNIGVIVLNSGWQRDKFLGGTSIHTVTIDFHWRVTLWAYIYEVFTIRGGDTGVFQPKTTRSTCKVQRRITTTL